jgi:hypothetical protein
MEKTREVKRRAAAALLKEGQQEVVSGEAKIAIATRDLSAAAQDHPPAISPRTKRPVEDPESKAVELAHYEAQTSLCSLIPAANVVDLPKDKPKK